MPGFIDDIVELQDPIDVMYLMHKAYMKHSEEVEKNAKYCQSDESFKMLSTQLSEWLIHIYYHTDTEDIYMTGPLKDKKLHDGRLPLRENVSEHDVIRTSGHVASESIANMSIISPVSYFSINNILAMEEKNHATLMTKVKSVEDLLKELLGHSKLNTIFRRHLYEQIVALKVAEYDHFENEEAFVLPLVKDQMTKLEQLQCVEKLLFDEKSDYPAWIYDFIKSQLVPREAVLLDTLRKEIEELI